MSTSSSTHYFHGITTQRIPEEVNPENTDMPFHITERERRYTTITLREIRYPCGCPCHPIDPEAAKKQRQRAPSPDSRPQYMYHSRPELTPRTESQDSTNSTSSQGSNSARASIGNFFRRMSS